MTRMAGDGFPEAGGGKMPVVWGVSCLEDTSRDGCIVESLSASVKTIYFKLMGREEDPRLG